MGGSILFLVLAGTPVALLAAGLWGRVRDRRRLGTWLEARGYRPRVIEARYLTPGPFENIRAPGTKHGDTLYRVLATDVAGAEQVLWVRIPTRLLGQATGWELRRDEAPERTPAGLRTPGFVALVVALLVVVGGIIALFSYALRHQ
jgi:hypothetical protein